MFDTQKKIVIKAVHSSLGAPVVARRMAEEYMSKVSEIADRIVEQAQSRYDESAKEGAKIAKRFQNGTVVEEIQHRVDMDKVQDRVGKLRDQLDAALDSWRENFTPSEGKPAPEKVAVEGPKTVGKKTPANKPATKTSAKKTPAKKTTATKTTAARTTAAKRTTAKSAATTTSGAKSTSSETAASKSSATKKTPAAEKTTARKPAAAKK